MVSLQGSGGAANAAAAPEAAAGQPDKYNQGQSPDAAAHTAQEALNRAAGGQAAAEPPEDGAAAAQPAAAPAGADAAQQAQAAAQRQRALAALWARQQRYLQVLRQAEQTRARYPAFTLSAELADPDFARLLGAGVPVQTAYEVVHSAALMQSGMQLAAQRVANALRANASRPQENGISAVAAAVQDDDPRNLTRAQRAELRRRVARGETIVW